jgi:hypothetical protein
MYFHYGVDLDGEGKITGGRYYGDSARIDMVWTPLKPTQGGEKGNERGNPHVSVKEVLAIWRESVSEDVRKQWLNVDPTEEDRILPAEEPKPAEATASTTAEGNTEASTTAENAPTAPATADTATPAATATTTPPEAPAPAATAPTAPAAPEPPAVPETTTPPEAPAPTSPN